MCGPHWFMVPVVLRRVVWHHYTPGQEEGVAKVTPEWCRAAQAAIEAVLERERHRREGERSSEDEV